MAITSQPFNIAQTFYVDQNVTDNAVTVNITGVDLYFMYKPDSINNASGIKNPGITVYVANTIYNVPQITSKTYQQFGRAEWQNIVTSSDGSAPTRVKFATPVPVQTGQQYAICIAYDGNEEFTLWTAKQGMWEVNTRVIYDMATNNFPGNFFEYSSVSQSSSPDTAHTQGEYLSYWTPLTNSKLKFTVYAARFFHNGVPLVANSSALVSDSVHRSNLIQNWSSVPNELSYLYPSQCIENIAFNIDTSTVQAFVGAQRVYQNTVFYPGGSAGANTVAKHSLTVNGSQIVVANGTLPNGSAFNWANVYNGYTGVQYIVVTKNDGTEVNVNRVKGIINSTAIEVDEPITFSANNAKFLKPTPVGTVDSMMAASPFGKKNHFMFLTHSNANSSVRFVNNCIEAITISAGGTGYSNNDVLYIKGYEAVTDKLTGGYVAIANISTSGAGVILSVFLSNTGAGFTIPGNIVAIVANSSQIGNFTSNTSAGSGATFTYTVGATLQSEYGNNIFKSCIVSNLDINDVIPFFNVNVPQQATYDLALRTQYYVTSDAAISSGLVYYSEVTPLETPLTLLKLNKFTGARAPCFVSYSNEFNTLYANGAPNDRVNPLQLYSNNYVVKIDTTTPSDYSAVVLSSAPTFEFGKFIINNDYTLEETNSGNAWAKHLTTTINFTQLAEDIRVFLDVYRPANTDIQVYARIQNSGDPQQYTLEDYTRLTCISGNGVYSSTNSDDNYIEMDFGFQPHPNVALTFSATVTTTNASATITAASNNQFSSNLVPGNLIKLYDPLFPNTNFLIASVNSVTSNTVLVLDQIVHSNSQLGGNPALVGPGLLLDKMGWDHQAFNNVLNDNVVRYFNKSSAKYDGYDTLSLKIIMLSSQFGAIPRINDIRCIGVTA